MAEIPYQQIEKTTSYELIKWPAVDDGDVGAPYVRPGQADKTVHWDKATAFGGAVVFKGTLMGGDLAAARWITLTDPQGNALSKSANDLETVQENAYAYRPEGAAGAAAVDVYLLVR